MNILYNILEEYIDLLISGNTHDWLYLTEKTLYDFDFFFFSKNDLIKKSKHRDIRHWTAFLIYFTCLKNYKKLFWSKFNIVQSCSLHSFFTRTIGFPLIGFSEEKLKLKGKLREPFEKLFYGIWMIKKVRELKNSVQIWKKQFLKFLINEILNQSYFETVKKNLIELETKFFSPKDHYWQSISLYFIKKRFICMVIFLPELKPFLKKSFFSILNFEKLSYASNYKLLFKKINDKRVVPVCVNNLKLYFSKENTLFHCRFNSILCFLKKHSIQIIMKEIKSLKTVQTKKKVKRKEPQCVCLTIKKINKNNNIINLYLKDNKIYSSIPFNPFESLC